MKPALPPVAATLADWRERRVRAAEPALDRALAAASALAAPAQDELVAVLRALDDLGVDNESLAATIAYDATLDPATLGNDAVATMVEGQREAEKVWPLHANRAGSGGAEGLRRLLLAVIRDLRVVFILLARQLVKLRRAAALPDAQRRDLAQLAADIHAPLANRLGIWQVKWEMEDLAFRFLEPDIYKRIAKLLDERREDREGFIRDAVSALHRALAEAGIAADVAGRPKHIYSIWKKMQKKQADFEHLYDIRALRVLVDDVPTCYGALGVAHTLWPNVPGEFDDYIARPKGNDYRSLHTAVIGPDGRTVEVQIRTHEMHAHAELGVAAHWRYKEGGSADAAFERKVARMRQMLDTRSDSDEEFAVPRGAQTEVDDDRVYLLTPQGKVIDLNRGSTVLDFAYHVHTMVGHRCRGAKVNGRIVPITFQPASGDTIEILTGKTGEPRRDWIVAGAGFLNSPRAREKVRAWFRHADLERNVSAGRDILEKELKRLALTGTALETLPPRFGYRTVDELFVALGIGEVTPGQVARAMHEDEPDKPAKPLQSADPPKLRRSPRDAIVVHGVGNLMYVIAKCCQPLPGDPVSGFLTRGRGVSIHRSDCPSLAVLAKRDADRLVDVAWGGRDTGTYEVNIVVQAYDRKSLLKDVSAAISNANVDVLAASTRTDPAEGTAEMHFALRVHDFGQLSGLLSRIVALPNVLDARRVTGTQPR